MDSNKKYISQKDLSKIYRKELKPSLGVISDLKTGDPVMSVFLSHSHLDKTIVAKIGTLLKRLNTEIYVDWLDNSMPQETNGITAQMIKDKINSCHKFLFLATYHGIRSKWCMWELGVADILKGKTHLAILPIESNAGNWKGNEYINLYPEMKFISDLDNATENDVLILSKENGEIDLRNWLSSNG